MAVSYDIFVGAFLGKIAEFDFAEMGDTTREAVTDGFLRRAVIEFGKVCKYDLTGAANDEMREFEIDITEGDLDELVNIVSEGMVVQWLKPFVYRQESLENVLNTRDFTLYSPAELLMRVGNAYAKSQSDFTQMVREYSYNHGDLTSLHI